MKPKEVVSHIEQAIAQAKILDQKWISIENLENYLHKFKEALPDGESSMKMSFETEKLKKDIEAINARFAHERNLAHYREDHEYTRQLWDATFQYGHTALKSAILINGGAAAAMLAFIGNIWNGALVQNVMGPLTNSIILFCFGVASGALGTGFTYFTQYGYAEKKVKFARSFHVLTILLVLVSYSLFIFGCYEAYESFVEHLSASVGPETKVLFWCRPLADAGQVGARLLLR